MKVATPTRIYLKKLLLIRPGPAIKKRAFEVSVPLLPFLPLRGMKADEGNITSEARAAQSSSQSSWRCLTLASIALTG